MMNKFFKSDSERDLWIKLNAERIIFSDIMLGRTSRGIDVAMKISENQLKYDEEKSKEPRLSLAELLLSDEEVYYLSKNRTERKTDEFLKSFKSKIDPLQEH